MIDEVKSIAAKAAGKITNIYLHWSAETYTEYFDAYHINIGGDGSINLSSDDFTIVKEHTWNRNTASIGIAIAACKDATPDNFGLCPPKDIQITRMAEVVSALCISLNISCDIDHVKTHYEIAVIDKYGPGSGDPQTKWDLQFWPGVIDGQGGNIIRAKALSIMSKDPAGISLLALNSKIRYNVLSEKYESNGDPGCVSSGSGDYGGVSYGLYQLASGIQNKVESFVEFCLSNGYAKGSDLKAAYPPGSSSFSAAWKAVAESDPTGFTEVQYQYAYQQHFLPAVDNCKAIGIDLNKHSDALKCVVWSMAIQYPAEVTTAFRQASQLIGLSIPDLDNVQADENLIIMIYKLRGTIGTSSDEFAWIHSPPNSQEVANGVATGMINECADALALLKGDGAAVSKIISNGAAVSILNLLESSAASDAGFKVTVKTSGTTRANIFQKLPIGETYCEPVYPDLTTVADHIPGWLVDNANIPTSKMVPDQLLNYTIPTSVLEDACGGDLSAILGSVKGINERQRIFDPTKYREAIKTPNPGKPANNNDPFPVDLKIEELETHNPRVKIGTIVIYEDIKKNLYGGSIGGLGVGGLITSTAASILSNSQSKSTASSGTATASSSHAVTAVVTANGTIGAGTSSNVPSSNIINRIITNVKTGVVSAIDEKLAGAISGPNPQSSTLASTMTPESASKTAAANAAIKNASLPKGVAPGQTGTPGMGNPDSNPSKELAKQLICLSDRVEKRMVKVENNLATIMRYVHRLSSRVNINCVYYGGQSA